MSGLILDIRFLEDRPSDQERAAVDALLGPGESSWVGGGRTRLQLRTASTGHAARGRRDLLLPALHALHDRIGWISRGGLNYVCQRLTVPPADAYGVATFYSMFSLVPRPNRVVLVCEDLACRVRGVPEFAPHPAVHHSPCLGLCEHAPAALVIEAGEPARVAPLIHVDAEGLFAALTAPIPTAWNAAASVPQAGLSLLARIGRVDPTSLDAYRGAGGYGALTAAIAMGPLRVIEEITVAGLLGRGGAAFPAGRKWAAVASQPAAPHYVICNADESEPGTFKDRVLMEGDPFAVVEAITIAGFATGSARGFIYLRGEYPVAHERIGHAIAAATRAGLLGDDIMGSGHGFQIEIRKGAGAYICGEETAIFNSIEGYRGEPRSKPPFPVEVGLFGKPTLVNNVETLVNVLQIVRHGGVAYASVGTAQSTGTKLFCLSGNIAAPGVYEVAFGTTLRELIALAGGVVGGRALQAVLLGGAAGSFVGPDDLDVPLTFEGTRAIGASLGSGVVMVLDDRVDLPGFLLRIAAFFRDESCGQCVPCRVGTVRQEEALRRLFASPNDADRELLDDVGRAMRDASICGLGQTAYNAIESALQRLLPQGAAR